MVQTPSQLRSLGHTEAAAQPILLRALWSDAQGDWHSAHTLAQDVDDADGAWVHAYLHRREGDPGNAAYWYRIARKPVCSLPLEAEWDSIVTALLQRQVSPTARGNA